jgi:hypothetical protein
MIGRVPPRTMAPPATRGEHDGHTGQHGDDSDRHELGAGGASYGKLRPRRRPRATRGTSATRATRCVSVGVRGRQLSLADGEAVPLRRFVGLGVARRSERHTDGAGADERCHRPAVREGRAPGALIRPLKEDLVAGGHATGEAAGGRVVAAGAVGGPIARRHLGCAHPGVGGGGGGAGTTTELGARLKALPAANEPAVAPEFSMHTWTSTSTPSDNSTPVSAPNAGSNASRVRPPALSRLTVAVAVSPTVAAEPTPDGTNAATKATDAAATTRPRARSPQRDVRRYSRIRPPERRSTVDNAAPEE